MVRGKKFCGGGIVAAERWPIIEGVPTAHVVSSGELTPTPPSVTELNNTPFIPLSNATAPDTNTSESPFTWVKLILEPFQKVWACAAEARHAMAARMKMFRRMAGVLRVGFVFIDAMRIDDAVCSRNF